MIIRIFQITIHPELRQDFERDFATISVKAVDEQNGFISCEIGKPTRWNEDNYVMITKWADEESLRLFAGDEWNKSVIPSGMEKYVKSCSVVHYNVNE